MTASPEAQVPNTDNDPITAPLAIGPSPAQEPLLHTGTSLEQAVEDRAIKGMNEDGTIDIPNHVPRGLIENPDAGGAREVVPADKKKGWVKPVAVGATILTVASIGYTLLSRTNSEPDSLKSGADSDRSTSAPESSGGNQGIDAQERPTLDSATPEQFYDDNYFTDAERVAWTDKQLNSPSTNPNYPDMTAEQAAYEQINANLFKSNGLQLGKQFSGLTKPSIDNTPQEVDTQQYVGLAAVMFEPDLDKAEKMLAGIDDNGSESNRNMMDDIVKFRNTKPSAEEFYGQTLALYYTPWDKNSNPLKPQATGISSSSSRPLGNIYPVDGVPTRVVMQRVSQDADRPNSPDFEVVYTFVDNKRWTQQETIRPSDVSKWIPPEQLVNILVD